LATRSMKPMTEKQRSRWERLRAKGKRRFIVINVIAHAASPVLTLVTLHLALTGTAEFMVSTVELSGAILAGFLLSMWGYVRSLATWDKQEARYHESCNIVPCNGTNISTN
jgi:hypothetical protein